jgi:hypothetical protein
MHINLFILISAYFLIVPAVYSSEKENDYILSLSEPIIVKDQRLLIYSDKKSHSVKFKVSDFSEIQYVEVVVDARVTPKGYNELADGANPLSVYLNGELPISGEFGMAEEVIDYFKRENPALIDRAKKWVWYLPSYMKGSLGPAGERRVMFSRDVLVDGVNVLVFESEDPGDAPRKGDGIFLNSFKVRAIPELIVLFDETHDEWRSISKEKAKEMYEKYPTVHTDYPTRKVAHFDYSPLIPVMKSIGLKPVRLLKPPITIEKINNASVLAIFKPETEFSEEEKKAIYEYVHSGGGLILTEPWSLGGRDLAKEFGIGVSGRSIRPKDESSYKTIPVVDHPITQGVKVFMKNLPLIYRCLDCTVLLRSPDDVYVDENGNKKYDADEPVGSFPVMVYKEVGKGKILVIGQSYIFAKDNEDYNSELFAAKVFSWLAGLPMPAEEGLPVISTPEESREFEAVQKRAFFGPSIDEALPELLTNQQFLMITPLILGFLTLLIQLFRGS